MSQTPKVVHPKSGRYHEEALRVLFNHLSLMFECWIQMDMHTLVENTARVQVTTIPAEIVAQKVWVRFQRDEQRKQEIGSARTVNFASTEDDEVFMLGQYIYEAIRREIFDMRRREACHQRKVEVGEGNVAVNGNYTPDEIDDELTTEEAAKLLKVSRPHVAKLVDTGELSARMVGWLRKLSKREVLAYKEIAQRKSRKAAQKVVQMVEVEEADCHPFKAGEGPTAIRG